MKLKCTHTPEIRAVFATPNAKHPKSQFVADFNNGGQS